MVAGLVFESLGASRRTKKMMCKPGAEQWTPVQPQLSFGLVSLQMTAVDPSPSSHCAHSWGPSTRVSFPVFLLGKEYIGLSCKRVQSSVWVQSASQLVWAAVILCKQGQEGGGGLQALPLTLGLIQGPRFPWNGAKWSDQMYFFFFFCLYEKQHTLTFQ